ncbi:MAG: response regulator [Tepidisphaeraceae bacterium]
MSIAAPNNSTPATAAGKKVLLVEDHADTATVISLLLKKFGHTVVAKETVQGGLEAFTADTFDIVLSDLSLPDGSGLDFVRQLRTTSDVPAVALTGYGMDDDIRRCTEAGFNAHLIKPVNFAELDTIIRRLTTPAA